MPSQIDTHHDAAVDFPPSSSPSPNDPTTCCTVIPATAGGPTRRNTTITGRCSPATWNRCCRASPHSTSSCFTIRKRRDSSTACGTRRYGSPGDAMSGGNTPNELTGTAWTFLRPYIENADASVFSRRVYAPGWLDDDRPVVIPPPTRSRRRTGSGCRSVVPHRPARLRHPAHPDRDVRLSALPGALKDHDPRSQSPNRWLPHRA